MSMPTNQAQFPSDSVIQDLEQPFSEEEIAIAISSLKNNKSPGPDGYTTQLYKTLG